MLTTIISRTSQMLILMGMLLPMGNEAQGAGEVWSGRGTITYIEAGWGADTMAVGHTATMANPGCTVLTGGYATDPGDPGHSLYHTVILNAFLNKRDVQFLLLGCVYGKPKIIAVKIY